MSLAPVWAGLAGWLVLMLLWQWRDRNDHDKTTKGAPDA